MACVRARDGGGRDMTIDAYLAELERRLPRIARRRALVEAQEHLRDSAARHHALGLDPAHAAEAAAVADFGPWSSSRAARGGAARSGRHASRRSSRSARLPLFVFPLYVVPENTLPPAPGWRSHVTSSFSSSSQSPLARRGCACGGERGHRLDALASHRCAGSRGRLRRHISGSSAVAAALVVRWFAVTPRPRTGRFSPRRSPSAVSSPAWLRQAGRSVTGASSLQD